MRSILIALFVFSVLSLNGYATPQIPDILIYEGKEYPVQTEFLGEYFKKYPERNPKREDESCSALWRGYQASFEVVEGKIYLKDVAINVCFGPRTSQLKKVVPDGERLFVDWVSYLVWSGYGGNSEDPYSLESLDAYEKYSFFEVDKGRVLEVRHFDNKGYREFKKKQYEAFRQTPEYEQMIKEMLEANPKATRESVESSIEFWNPLSSKKFLVEPDGRPRTPGGRPPGKAKGKKVRTGDR